MLGCLQGYAYYNFILLQMLGTLVVPVVAYKSRFSRVTKLPPVLPKLIKVHEAV